MLAAEIPAYFPDGFFWTKLIFSNFFLVEDRLKFSKHGPYHRCILDDQQHHITIPCHFGKHDSICSVSIDNTSNWSRKHWNTIRMVMGQFPYSDYLLPELEPLFEYSNSHLSQFLFRIIRYLKYIWRLDTKIMLMSESFTCQLPKLYVNEWQLLTNENSILIFPDELKFLNPHVKKQSVIWRTIRFNNPTFEEELKHNGLYLLLKYGTDLPGLIKKETEIIEEQL
ncbi:MAG: hypothetical protein Kow00108_02600 [Calditrichia bacterium]